MAPEVILKPEVQLPAEPPPRRSGAIAVLRFWARNRMLTPKYALLVARLVRRRLTPAGRRMVLDGMLFLGPRVTIQIGRARAGAIRALGVDRARDEDPLPRGRGLDR